MFRMLKVFGLEGSPAGSVGDAERVIELLAVT